MKEKILELLNTFQQPNYDKEMAHQDYDLLLEEFIFSDCYNDNELLTLIKRLIKMEKSFWYA